MNNGEDAEKESPTHDGTVEPEKHGSHGRMEAVLEHMRRDQNK